jgi:hypothetical protein
MRVILCAFFLSLLFSSCKEEQKEKPQGDDFLFYPLPNIYFDEDNKEYYFFDSTKTSWQKTGMLPAPVVARLGRSVKLDSVPVPVYKDNETHRLIHGAILYSSPDTLRRQYREDSLASLPRKDTVVKADSTPVKKKSRLGILIEKLFGKKKK